MKRIITSLVTTILAVICCIIANILICNVLSAIATNSEDQLASIMFLLPLAIYVYVAQLLFNGFGIGFSASCFKHKEANVRKNSIFLFCTNIISIIVSITLFCLIFVLNGGN